MWQRHNAQLANFDVTSLRVISVHYQWQHLTLRKRSSYPGAFHHRRILPQPCETDARTSNPTASDHQRVNVEIKMMPTRTRASAMRRYLSRVESLMTNHYHAK